MKYEKNNALDRLIEAAIAEMPDTEGEEFESIDDSDEEPGDQLNHKINLLISEHPKKKTTKFYPRLMSPAALLAFVTVFAVWMAMINAFGILPNLGKAPDLTDQTMGIPNTSDKNTTETKWTSSDTEFSGFPGKQTVSNSQNSLPSSKHPLTPTDEKKAYHIVEASNADGLTIEVTLHGYQSQSLSKDFYVKNDEYFAVDVKITNTSDHPVYQYLPTSCRESNPPHNHEIDVDLELDNYTLCTSSFGFTCAEAPNAWTLEPGKTYEWNLKLAAGEASDVQFDLPADGNAWTTGIQLYDDSIYTNGSCIFSGNIIFSYKKNNETNRNDFALLVPLSIEVIHITKK